MKMAEVEATLITRLRGLACSQQGFRIQQLLSAEATGPATPLHRWKLMGVSSAVAHQGAVEFMGIEIEFEILQHTATAVIQVPQSNRSGSEVLNLFNPMTHMRIQHLEGSRCVLLQPPLQQLTSL